MKKRNIFVGLLMIFTLVLSSCDNALGTEVGKTSLTQAIEAATELKASKTVGTADGQVPEAAMTAYAAAITAAEAVEANVDATEADVTSAISALASATVAFNESVITNTEPDPDPEPNPETVPEDTLLTNGDFALDNLVNNNNDTADIWSYYTGTGSTVSITDGKLNYEISELGDIWANQLWHAKIPMTEGWFEFTFTASSTVARDIFAKVEPINIGGKYFEDTFSITDTETVYTMKFKTHGAIDGAVMRPLFALGATGVSSPSTVTFDNVYLRALADSEIPAEITLVGDAAITLEVGADYTDAGATAEDNIDGDISSDIDVVSDVNTAEAGTYTVTYNVTDSNGNKAAEVVRTVVVAAPANTNGWIYSTGDVPADGTQLTYGVDTWGSGAVANTAYAGDAIYNPCIEVQAGANAWGGEQYAAVFAVTGLEAGAIVNYTNLKFKIKYTDFTLIPQVAVKMPGATTEQIEFTMADNGTDLGNGWYEMEIPLADFGTIPGTINEFAILEFDNDLAGNPMYITDIFFEL